MEIIPNEQIAYMPEDQYKMLQEIYKEFGDKLEFNKVLEFVKIQKLSLFLNMVNSLYNLGFISISDDHRFIKLEKDLYE